MAQNLLIVTSYLSARLFARLPLHPLARLFGLFCSERLFACVDSAPWRYLHPLARLVWALLLRTAFCLRRFRPMAISSSACSPCLGSFAPNGFLLASIPPHGDIFLPLARNVLAPFWSRTASLAFNPPHGDILFSPPSWRCSIFLRLTATSNFLPPPWHLIGAFRHHANAKQRTGAMMRPRRFRHLPPSRFFPHHGVALLLAFLPGSWISAPSAFTPGHSYSFITPILLARGHSLPSR